MALLLTEVAKLPNDLLRPPPTKPSRSDRQRPPATRPRAP